MKVKINEDKELVNLIRQQIKENGGYCPCVIEHNEDNKCMCKDFLENVSVGEYCHCGLYKKIEQ